MMAHGFVKACEVVRFPGKMKSKKRDILLALLLKVKPGNFKTAFTRGVVDLTGDKEEEESSEDDESNSDDGDDDDDDDDDKKQPPKKKRKVHKPQAQKFISFGGDLSFMNSSYGKFLCLEDFFGRYENFFFVLTKYFFSFLPKIRTTNC